MAKPLRVRCKCGRAWVNAESETCARCHKSHLQDRLELLARWADRVELTTGHHGWTLTCLTHGQQESCTHTDLSELVTYFLEHAVFSGKWSRGFYEELDKAK